MQDAAREHWRKMVTHDEIPDDVDDFGFYYAWDYVQMTCGLALLSKFALLPREGGMDNQDWFWLQDLMTYLQGYAYAQYEARPVEHDDSTIDAPPQSAKWKPFG